MKVTIINVITVWPLVLNTISRILWSNKGDSRYRICPAKCWIEVLNFDDVAVSYFTTTQSETFNEPLTGTLVLLGLGGLFPLSSMSLESDEEFDEHSVSNDSSDQVH